MPRDYRLYLDDILEAIEWIVRYTEDLTFDDFEIDRKTQDAVIKNLQVIGEAARHLPDSVCICAPEIDWRKIIGMRNILIHEYFGINTAIVWDIVTNKLEFLQISCLRLYEMSNENH